MKPVKEVLQGVQRYILLAQFQPMQGRIARPVFGENCWSVKFGCVLRGAKRLIDWLGYEGEKLQLVFI